MGLMMLVLPASPGSCDLIIHVKEATNPKQDITVRCSIILTKYYQLPLPTSISQKTQDVGRARIIILVLRMRKQKLREVK